MAADSNFWDPGWDPKWDDAILGRRWRQRFDRARYRALCIAVACQTASWALVFAVVWGNPHTSVYVVGIVIGSVILLLGRVWPRSALAIVGLWALTKVVFIVLPPWPLLSFVALPLDAGTLIIVITEAPWRREPRRPRLSTTRRRV